MRVQQPVSYTHLDVYKRQITDWLKEMLVSAIMGNLAGMFESVNNQVGEIATSVGMTPANFSRGVFAMVRNISESVIIPIAGLIPVSYTHLDVYKRQELAGKETMPAIVRDLDDDAAIILMVAANLQRARDVYKRQPPVDCE